MLNQVACRPRCFLFVAISCVLTVMPLTGLGQTVREIQSSSSEAERTPNTLPQFEVASVKPSNSRFVGLFTYPGGRIAALGYTLKLLIRAALDVQYWQISGGDGWTDDVRFDLEAKPPIGSKASEFNPVSFKTPPTHEQRQMLEALLVDRFRLKFHRTSRQGTVFVLRLNGGKLKLRPTSQKDQLPAFGGVEGGGVGYATGISGRNISMPQLATQLSGYLSHPVLDETGLKGSFDFEYRTGDDNPESDVKNAIIASLQAIGLKVTSQNGPVEHIVIDYAERPSPN